MPSLLRELLTAIQYHTTAAHAQPNHVDGIIRCYGFECYTWFVTRRRRERAWTITKSILQSITKSIRKSIMKSIFLIFLDMVNMLHKCQQQNKKPKNKKNRSITKSITKSIMESIRKSIRTMCVRGTLILSQTAFHTLVPNDSEYNVAYNVRYERKAQLTWPAGQ